MTDTLTIPVTRVEKSRIQEVDFNNIPFGRIFSDHMFLAEYSEGSWKNPRIVPYGNLAVSPAISALHYGQSIFEGLKAFRTVDNKVTIFRPVDNLRRMQRSADRMCMPPITEELFIEGLRQLIELDAAWVPSQQQSSLYIRPFQFATDSYVGIRPSDTYQFVIFSCPVSAYYAEPVRVKVETHYSRSMEGGTGFAKTAGNYAAALYPAKLAQAKGYHQLVWTDSKTHEYIEESGTMNVMFIVGDTLLTAPANECILNGVTRDSVLTLARDWGMKVQERPVRVQEILEALEAGTLVEAFGTGTAATIAHIAVINLYEKDYTLPPMEKRAFSNKVLAFLEDLKRGKVQDSYQWNMVVA
jgi:branched-chain amino acid aminotransferase